MKRTTTIAAALLAVTLGGFSLVTIPTSVVAKAAMPDPALTGAPSEGTCFTCHNGALDDGDGGILFFGVPSAYTPDQTYPIAVIVTRVPGATTRWGFEATVLTSGNQMAGVLDDNNNNVGKQTQNGITYISQTTLKGSDGTYADSLGGVWTFYWTAPSAGAGPVTFYGAGAACDQDNAADAGDFTYTGSISSAEGTPTDVEGVTWGKLKQIYR